MASVLAAVAPGSWDQLPTAEGSNVLATGGVKNGGNGSGGEDHCENGSGVSVDNLLMAAELK